MAVAVLVTVILRTTVVRYYIVVVLPLPVARRVRSATRREQLELETRPCTADWFSTHLLTTSFDFVDSTLHA